MDTITGKTKALSASWQELSGNLLNSELVKGFMDLAMLVVNGFNDINQATGGLIGQITLCIATASVLVVLFGTLKATAVKNGIVMLGSSFKSLATAIAEAWNALRMGQYASASLSSIGTAATGVLSKATLATAAVSALVLLACNYTKPTKRQIRL